MKIRLERSALVDAVAWSARTLPTRPTVQTLLGLLLEADEESGLRVSGYDYEVAGQARAAATVLEAGRVLVNGRLLADIARSLPNEPVELTLDGGRIRLVCGSTRFTLPVLTVEDYPELPSVPNEVGTVAGPLFATAVSQVAAAAGKDDTIPALTGIRMELEGPSMKLVATDRFRLAVRELPWEPNDASISTTALIPARTLADTAKQATVTQLGLALGPGPQGDLLAGFVAGTRTTTTGLVSGDFPKYAALFPPAPDTIASMSTSALSEAVKRVQLVTASSRSTPIRFTFAGEELLLEAGTGEDAQASERIAVTLNGEGLSIAFNPQFLLDGLGQLEGSTTRMAFTQPTRPAVLSSDADSEGSTYKYLVMPVRLPG